MRFPLRSAGGAHPDAPLLGNLPPHRTQESMIYALFGLLGFAKPNKASDTINPTIAIAPACCSPGRAGHKLDMERRFQHAPTVAQCQADQRLWLSDLEEPHNSLPVYAVLGQWNVEMSVCETVDPDNFWKYYNTRGEISSERVIRLVDFLDRHNLTDQFKAEGAAGKR
jgi:hypothetical protein